MPQLMQREKDDHEVAEARMKRVRNVWLSAFVGETALWILAIVLAAVAVAFSRETPFHQLAIGVLATLVSLFVLLSAVELIWRALTAVFGGVKEEEQQ